MLSNEMRIEIFEITHSSKLTPQSSQDAHGNSFDDKSSPLIADADDKDPKETSHRDGKFSCEDSPDDEEAACDSDEEAKDYSTRRDNLKSIPAQQINEVSDIPEKHSRSAKVRIRIDPSSTNEEEIATFTSIPTPRDNQRDNWWQFMCMNFPELKQRPHLFPIGGTQDDEI